MKWPLTAGITLGLGEAVWLLGQNQKTLTASEAVLVLLYGAGVYGFGVLLLALLCSAILKINPDKRNFPFSLPYALGLSAGLFSGTLFLLRVARPGFPDILFTVAACVALAVFCGLIVERLARSIPLLETRAIWVLLNAALLLGGVGITLVLSTSRSARDVHATRRDRPNVVLISIDTLRADYLGVYGNTRVRTPNIDRLARSGIMFEQAVSPVPLTGPAHTTMLTGLYPARHGATANGIPIRSNVMTLPRILSDRGYRTAAFVSGWTLKDVAAGLAPQFGRYDQNFSRWRFLPDAALDLKLIKLVAKAGYFIGHPLERIEREGEQTTRRVMKWMNQYRHEPFFLFVHYFDTHAPHRPPRGANHPAPPTGDLNEFSNFHLQPYEVKQRIVSDPAQKSYMQSLYEAEVAHIDEQVGKLLAEIDRLGIAHETLVIFTADHGESLTEHGYYFDHGEFLYDTCIRVPLILKMHDDRWSGVGVKQQVHLVDLTPTILELLSIKAGGQLDGRSMVPILNGTERTPRGSFGALHAGDGDNARSRYYARANGHKLIWNFDGRERLGARPFLEEFYDLINDPGEQKNLIHSPSKTLDQLRKNLGKWIQQNSPAGETPSEEVQERLRALGYL